MLEPAVLAGRDRYERVMHGRVDNTHDDAFTHTVRLTDDDRELEVSVVALPPPTYAIREARLTAVAGRVAASLAPAFAGLAGSEMVGGLTRRTAELLGGGDGAGLAVDATIEVARLARQVTRMPRALAERATSGDPLACWTRAQHGADLASVLRQDLELRRSMLEWPPWWPRQRVLPWTSVAKR